MSDPIASGPPAPAPAAVSGWYPHDGQQRYWDGSQWTDHFAPAVTEPSIVQVVRAPTNGFATAAMLLGIFGFVFMAIPFFGWLIGGIPDVLAVIFAIVALVQIERTQASGKAAAVVGLCFGGVSLLSLLIGAGTIW